MSKNPNQRTAIWLSPCATGTLTRSVIHFFPAARGVSAPYAAECRLTLFMGGAEANAAPEEYSVLLEGARLSQPDGLWLDDAFPMLKESNRSAGLILEISSESSRADLSASSCVMEFHSGFNLCRFFPAAMQSTPDGSLQLLTQDLPSTALFIDDQQISTSLILVNRSGQSLQPVVELVCPAASDQRGCAALLPFDPIGVSSVAEFDVAKAARGGLLVHPTKVQQTSFGDSSLGTIRFRQSLPEGCIAFIVYRDAKNRQPISIRPFSSRNSNSETDTFTLTNP